MSKILNEYFSNSIRTSEKYLLKIRLWFYSLTYCLMVVIGFILLRIDFTVAEDPLVRLYHHNRWLLITSWFNLISLVYTPICIYCDWRELRGTSGVKHVTILNKFRFVCFSSILFPVTCFSDILFWRLWTKNRELVAPPAVDVLVPLWLQHCLHTITLVVILLDLLLVPKRRPKNLTFGVYVLTTFLAAYAVTCGRSIVNNEHIYPLLRLFSGYNFIPLVIFVSVEHFFYFTIQWLLLDFLWGRRSQTHVLISLLRFPSRHLEFNEIRKDKTELTNTGNQIKNSTNKINTS
ncbi:androgen-dependent TFPI-regulating protein-like [Cydia pomonella]|uniref:androgen-dependent TFPI-regulating protein-like n=1 Tax=Cydia pomonella TaxID=82600 RepID=UPI002ADD9362|nr:androgen-dependent TFPI-regulating protein-like [Cydia pomonella]